MKKVFLSVLGLLLAAVLLVGCMSGAYVKFEDMTYQRPDMTEIQTLYDAFCQTAAEEEDPEKVIRALFDFYHAYDWFYTCYSLADIHYSGDLTDIYWEKEYNYCAGLASEVDALLEDMYYVLAAAPSREALEGEDYFGADFFDDYEGENQWDDYFAALLETEAELEAQYYALTSEALDYEPGSQELYDALGEDMGQILVELVQVRQEQAAYWGYSDYGQFAGEFYYYRDYTTEQAAQLLAAIQEELAGLYREVVSSEVWAFAQEPSGEKETLAFLRKAAKAMGGTVWDAFQVMEEGELYDIAYGENKYNTSFEVYLPSYQLPFVFVSPGLVQYDRLVLAHEFGHFCEDHAAGGSYTGIDVSEVFSQGMEYLTLCYGEDTEELVQVKMADSLGIYVEQAAFAAFEQELYRQDGQMLTVEDVNLLYSQVIGSFGMDTGEFDSREYVEVPHFFTDPMYVISYVVSNDAAMQLYQLEREQPGAGLAKLEACFENGEADFLDFLEAAGLESPFAPERMETVREIFEKAFD